MGFDDYSSSSSSSPSSIEHSTATKPSLKRRAGRKKFRETRHSIYSDVRERNGGRWVCDVREPLNRNRIWLGTFPTPEMAARAHDVAAIALFAASRRCSTSQTPRGHCLAPDDIRKAASKAAQMFRCCEAEYTSSTGAAAVLPASAELVVNNGTLNSEGGGRSGEAFLDEEALFNMPGLLDSMAVGLLLTPPGMRYDWDASDCHLDMSLWTD